MAIDLQNLSAKELDTLINKAKARKTTLKKRKPITTVRARLKAAAAAEGYTIAELFGTGAAGAAPAATRKTGKAAKPAKAGRTLGKVAPKYRNPENPAETWTGRGMKPRWLAAQLAAGKSAEEFLIASE
ncbi:MULTISPECIES: H-NS histone family protein [unclassified Luteimonas]|uniref:H-NS histone family protein n=1 Tax=unclassified Luteimonas TaxID=2629088 RepID=UPI0016015F8C|nr:MULTISPECIES: H-NS histone family protein [unclassified Luteimonas]MBB1472844.1 H-NS histone family protein [Luteimonas sp. MC1782]MBB6598452.1 H-NS histone family protein [Luteimonas sp. MC1825]QOC88646.1 H-NS histone family protein [Luteimonas sp. MC1825]